jgi:DNA-binding MarR family transcriptional regulator|tara:strand:+ start:76 stop:549 length:474 start_codon:yes stop_codon:yes gene_type:complete
MDEPMRARHTLSELPGHLIRRLNQHSTAVFQSYLKAAGHDITSVQFLALETLAQNPGLDQATLAAQIAYDRATIGGVVKRLEQKELIKRQYSTTDRRAFQLRLTDEGRALLDKMRPIVASLQSDILEGLSAQERDIFIKLMQKALHLRPSDDQPIQT